MKTQQQTVLERIKKNGYADNFWAVNNFILRLGARIYDLRQEGHKIVGFSGKELGRPHKYHKNFYYFKLTKNK